MKKLILASLAMSLLNWNLTATCHAQSQDKKTKPDATVFNSFPGIDRMSIKKEDFGASRLNNISVKAVRDFDQSFVQATDRNWYVLDDGFVVYFKMNGIRMKTFYRKNGNRILTMSFSTEQNLPFDVRDLVKRNYYDFHIYMVIEIDINNEKIYLVKMEDNHSWKTIRVADAELQEVEHFRKPN